MPVKLTDKVYNEGGSPVQGAVAQAVRTNGISNTVVATDITDTKGIWAFDTAIAGHQPDLADPAPGEWYDVRINIGMQYRLRYGAIKAMMNMVYLAGNIVLGASQLFDASLAAMRVPVSNIGDHPAPGAGQILFRTDQKVLKIWDGTAWTSIGQAEAAYAGTVAVPPTHYTVAAGIMYVFCTTPIQVTLPAAASTNRPITVIGVAGGQSNVNAVSGTVYGGTPHPTTGVVQNGAVMPPDAYTYKSDGTNWRAV